MTTRVAGPPRPRGFGFVAKGAGLGAVAGALLGAYAALLTFAMGPDPEVMPSAAEVVRTAAAALSDRGWGMLLVGFALGCGLALGAAVGAVAGAAGGWLIARVDRDPPAA